MQQLEIEVLYNLQCESATSMFDLRDVVTYIAKRVGLIPGRVWFESGNRINVKLVAALFVLVLLVFFVVPIIRRQKAGSLHFRDLAKIIAVYAHGNTPLAIRVYAPTSHVWDQASKI